MEILIPPETQCGENFFVPEVWNKQQQTTEEGEGEEREREKNPGIWRNSKYRAPAALR